MPVDNNKKNTYAVICSFILGLVAGAGFYWLFWEKGIPEIFLIQKEDKKPEGVVGGDFKTEGDKSLSSEFPILLPGENTFVVANQPAGSSIIMSMISLKVSGWIAIHEKDAQGGIVTILGARRFNAGNYFAEPIDLLRVTEEGHVYVAVLHGDDGEGEFDFAKEIPLKDIKGSLV